MNVLNCQTSVILMQTAPIQLETTLAHAILVTVGMDSCAQVSNCIACYYDCVAFRIQTINTDCKFVYFN